MTAEPVSEMPSDEAEPSNEVEAVSSMEDPDFTPGEDDDSLNPAKRRRSNRKRVPSKKLKESSASAAEVEVEVGDARVCGGVSGCVGECVRVCRGVSGSVWES